MKGTVPVMVLLLPHPNMHKECVSTLLEAVQYVIVGTRLICA